MMTQRVITAEFLPTQIAGLTFWLDSVDLTHITKDGSNNITAWLDRSGNGNNATDSSAAPVWTANQINGLPAVYFNGSAEMGLPAGLFGIPNGASTLFVVARRSTDSGNFETILSLSDATAADYFMIYGTTAGTVLFKSRDGAGGAVTATTTTTNTNILMGRRSGTTQALAVNGGTEVTNTSAVDSASIDSGDIGASHSNNLRLTGYVGEYLLYNSSLSAANITKVLRYLSRKWGVALA